MMQEEIKLIGRRIRLLRTAKNLTQTGLAKEMGISQTHLCNIECGRVPVTLPNLLKLHSLLECNMASFFVDLDDQPETNKEKDIIILNYLKSTYSETETIKSILYQYATNGCNNHLRDDNIIKSIEIKRVKDDAKITQEVMKGNGSEIKINEETLRFFDE